MKIGLIGSFRSHLDSLKYSFTFIEQALGSRHDLIYMPQEYTRVAREQQGELMREWLVAPDVLVGLIDPFLAQVRSTMARRPPYIALLLGTMPRGAPNLRSTWKHLTSLDPLICNCVADRQLTHEFFPNARTRLLPLAFDESLFYPVDTATRNDIRKRMGFGAGDKILLYAGRMTLEKNVHTLLRIFSVLEKALPNVHLIVAGYADDTPFFEFGVSTPSIQRTLLKLAEKLSIPANTIRFVGHKTGPELRDLYNIADLHVNMTLHHDENFGLSQVESMACGTPVLATNWGGLKDTVIENETGAKVSTSVTRYGVKVDWYQAVTKILALLTDQSRSSRMKEVCVRTALQKYSLAAFRHNLNTIVDECGATADAIGEPLQTTEFAQRFWHCTIQKPGEPPVYRRSPEAYAMYRRLASTYGGLSTEGESTAELSPAQVVCLANPVALINQRTIMAEDPIFPFEIDLPDHLQHAVSAVVRTMTQRPLLAVQVLIRESCCAPADVMDAIRWMIDAGMLVVSMAKAAAIADDAVAHLGMPALALHGLDSDTDVVFTR